jgi:hypothetical protein
MEAACWFKKGNSGPRKTLKQLSALLWPKEGKIEFRNYQLSPVSFLGLDMII